ncbi:MAG: S9 family peptidase [Spirulinaceae cyanobacterium]
MSNKKTVPFGSWKSPITSALIVAGSIRLGGVAVDGKNLYWLEGRPSEGGRNVLVQQDAQGNITDITSAPYNIRTKVHEYGGGAFLVVAGTVYFSNFVDQRIYQQKIGTEPQPLTPESPRRYADAVLDQQRNRLICVCEEKLERQAEPTNTLVTVDLDSGEVQTLVSGSNFYASPRLSPDGCQLAWLDWQHPNLPWDATQLWIANMQGDGSLSEVRCLAGGEEEAIFEPRWSPDGKLYFASDRTGWWNLYRCNGEGEIEALWEMEAEFGYPHWVFGLSMYGFQSSDKLVCTYFQGGRSYLASLDLNTKEGQMITTPYTSIDYLQVTPHQLFFLGGSPTESAAVLQWQEGEVAVIKTSSDLAIDSGYLSLPQEITFPTDHNLTAYAWYYPPQNKDYTPPPGELPPLLVKSHGGPTAAASPTLSLKTQYWTSRGFGVVDVNYGGSSGYGKEYRQRLDKQWGVVDVHDCANAAQYLVEEGKVDRERLVISGGSAGGYTTLCALTFLDIFKAGASYYGVSDLEVLAKETHKFESRYLDRLVGKYPQEKDLYVARSPIHFTERLSCPVIFFQGLEDEVTPPNQAEKMVTAIKNKGLPVAYVTFAGEQHGFRRAENIKRALDGEFYFYSQVFGFKPAEEIESVEIFNG